jgi:2-C-methyl-D-erythritol 4-phosphate cytidylyltransferase
MSGELFHNNPKTITHSKASRTANPTLDTIRMVEETLSKMMDHPTKNKLWRQLPRQIQYPTLQEVLKYLEESNKIVYDKNNKIVWIFTHNTKLQKLKQTSKSLLAQ